MSAGGRRSRSWLASVALVGMASGCATEPPRDPPVPATVDAAARGGSGGRGGNAGMGGNTAAGAAGGMAGAPATAGADGGGGGQGGSALDGGMSVAPDAAVLADSRGPSGADTSSPPAAGTYPCNQFMGVSTNGEWYNGGGFEKYVDGARWQILWKKHGFFDTWGPGGTSWSTATLDSPCAMNSNNPDRVVFTGVNYDNSNEQAWVDGLVKVVNELKRRYSNLKRIDLITPIRAPMNKGCNGSTSSENHIFPSVDRAMAKVAAMFPDLVYTPTIFYAESCSWFVASNDDKLSSAGAAAAAKMVGEFFAPTQ